MLTGINMSSTLASYRICQMFQKVKNIANAQSKS